MNVPLSACKLMTCWPVLVALLETCLVPHAGAYVSRVPVS